MIDRKVFDVSITHSGIVFTTCGFIFTWTPFAVTLFISAFRGDYAALPPLVTFLSACFAKTSVIWIPMIYISTSTHFQLRFVNAEALDHNVGSNRVDTVGRDGVTAFRNNGTTAIIRGGKKDEDVANEQQ
jgi:hypothetical protein